MIAIEDFKQREVHWFWFLLFAVPLGLLYSFNTTQSIYLLNIGFNSLLLFGILLVLFLYTTVIRKKVFINHSLGLGDIFIFFGLALGFPAITFLILFVSALLFSLLVYQFIKSKDHYGTIPLAGLISIFLGMVLLGAQFLPANFLYQH